MEKKKLVRLCLLGAIALICLILLIATFKMLTSFPYANLSAYIGGVVFVGSKSYVSYYDAAKVMMRTQLIVLIINLLVAGLLCFGELKEKCFSGAWAVLLIVSLLEVGYEGNSGFIIFLSFLPILCAIAFKILGGNKKKVAVEKPEEKKE